MELEGGQAASPHCPGSPAPWRGDLQSSPGPCGGCLELKAGCRIMGRAGKENAPGSSSALMDHVPVTSTEQQWDMQRWEMQGWEMLRLQHRHPGRLPQCAQFQTGSSHGKVLIQRYKTTSKSEQINP